ncbi:hypothetical protein GP486_001398 [Trichoglossum hirsutum]|uniref:Myb-like domain-containing protein n=1 Tax=Trichoglossum hirsutum TaxID=265104 RepID=A0A9P8RSP1_9PEZI|nr:hypothetical protein GP486_001398 [Trichoglossum hirsutum]
MAESPSSAIDASANSLSKFPIRQMRDSDAQQLPHRRSSLKIADLINDNNEPVRARGSDTVPTTLSAGSWPLWSSQRIRVVEPDGGEGPHRPRSYSHTTSPTGYPLTEPPPARPRSAGTNATTLFSDLAPPIASHQTRQGRSRQSSVSTQSTSSSFAKSHGREFSKSLSPQAARERRESRPAYQVEEDTFIWYHRDDLGMQWNDVSKAYNAQFPDRPRIGRQGIQSRYYRVLEVEGVPKIRKRPKSLKPKRIRHHYGVIARTNRRYPWMQGAGGLLDERPDRSRKVSRSLDGATTLEPWLTRAALFSNSRQKPLLTGRATG